MDDANPKNNNIVNKAAAIKAHLVLARPNPPAVLVDRVSPMLDGRDVFVGTRAYLLRNHDILRKTGCPAVNRYELVNFRPFRQCVSGAPKN